TARQLAAESAVLLKNNQVLPVGEEVKSIAVIGPLADAPHDQLGTWIFDGSKEHAITPLHSIREYGAANGITIHYHRALELSRSDSIMDAEAILSDVQQSDLVLLFLGEESILSGESHSRANIDLPGAQEELVRLMAETTVPVAAIIMAGRPLTFESVEPLMDAVLYAWHPGTMAGPAITDLLFGALSPSGKLPVTFPRHVGQIPLYYNHKKTGKPASDETWERMEDIPAEAPQLSIGNTSHYLDYGFEPMYPFGFGLSYSTFEMADIQLDKEQYGRQDTLQVSLTLRNTGMHEAAEVVQIYTRQLFGSRTRPIRELRDFQKVMLRPGESQQITFAIAINDLGFHNPAMNYVVEPGAYHLWVAADSNSGERLEFEITN
ncbi:MAG: glycoside hydrolase family 3 C-terminal domain-containing protein, partial [Bacteroidales bacterium]